MGLQIHEETTEGALPPIDYLPGHVFFFDAWVDDSHNEFWAYESSQTQNQTQACRNDTHECFNHHVKKERSLVKKYSKQSCKTLLHGTVTGGPRRVLGSILCPPTNRPPASARQSQQG